MQYTLRLRQLGLVLLVILGLFGCKSEGPTDYDEPVIYDIISPMLVFDLRDSQGNDLLSEDNPEREELLKSLHIKYEGKTYPVVISDKPIQRELRHLPAFFSGFHYAPLYYGVDKREVRLKFGELVGYKNASHRVEFVWPSGQTEVITFDNTIIWRKNRIEDIKRVFTLNGKVIPSEMITLVRPEQK